MSDIDDMMGSMIAEEKRQAAHRKDDTIIKWMTDHWQLFTRTKYDMQTAIRMLGREYPYSPDGLSQALQLPDYVHFLKIQPEAAIKSFVSFPGSDLFDKFLALCDKHKDQQALLMAVTGRHTLIVTNKDTRTVKGKMLVSLPSFDDMPPIHLFWWQDAPERMPWLFEHI